MSNREEFSDNIIELVRRLHELITIVYGSSFLTVLNFYLNEEREKRGAQKKDIFTLLLEEPREAYEYMLHFFKKELAMKIFLESLFVKTCQETAKREWMVNKLISSLKENNHDEVLRCLLELSQV